MQVTSGLQFIEIMENIKKTLKNLKQSNFGKKIYDNLISNYGEYLNVAQINKTIKLNYQKVPTASTTKKSNSKKEKINTSNLTNC